MTDGVIPLSRRFRLVVLLSPIVVVGLLVLLLDALRHPAVTPLNTWMGIGALIFILGTWYYVFVSPVVADYDSSYLYVFKRTGTQSIPLGSLSKLTRVKEGWHLNYYDEHGKTKQLLLTPLNRDLLGRDEYSSIHGFIYTVREHNPQLDVCPPIE